MVAETMMAVGDLVIRKAASHRWARIAQNANMPSRPNPIPAYVALPSDDAVCASHAGVGTTRCTPSCAITFHRASQAAFAFGLLVAIEAGHSHTTAGSCHPQSFGELLRKDRSEGFCRARTS
jgi:hypothetical protein